MTVMIGVDPHKGSHTAVALDDSEQPSGELRVRSAANQVERLITPLNPNTSSIRSPPSSVEPVSSRNLSKDALDRFLGGMEVALAE